MAPVTHVLSRLLHFPTEEPVLLSFRDLRIQIVDIVGERGSVAEALIKCRDESLENEQLLRLLWKVVPYDSVVRDIVTVGHLAKVIARWDVLQATKKLAIAGLPNRLFDELSQQDRSSFLSRCSFDLDAEAVESPEAQRMMAWEEEVLARYGL